MVVLGGTRFSRLFFAICLFLVLLTLSSLWRQQSPLTTVRSALDHQRCSPPPTHTGTTHQNPPPSSIHVPQVRKRIAIGTRFGFHRDVLFALVWTIGRVLNSGSGSDSGQLSVYVPSPLSWNFQDVVTELGLYKGEMKNYEDII
jgi:hypothetical protein